jgi:hypothetical protein
MARTPYRFEGDARSGFAAIAFDFEPAVSAVKALRDGRRRLRGAAITLHMDRSGFGLGTIGLTEGLLGGFARAIGAYLRADDPATVDCLPRLGAHGRQYSGPCDRRQCH